MSREVVPYARVHKVIPLGGRSEYGIEIDWMVVSDMDSFVFHQNGVLLVPNDMATVGWVRRSSDEPYRCR